MPEAPVGRKTTVMDSDAVREDAHLTGGGPKREAPDAPGGVGREAKRARKGRAAEGDGAGAGGTAHKKQAWGQLGGTMRASSNQRTELSALACLDRKLGN